jgi:hypothetical protein
MTTQWFRLGKARFLIRPPDPGVILFLNEKRKRDELSDEGMQKEIFSSVLIKWEGMGNGGAFPRAKQLDALFDDLEIRAFVLGKAMELLEVETRELENACISIERNLLKSGRLKS